MLKRHVVYLLGGIESFPWQKVSVEQREGVREGKTSLHLDLGKEVEEGGREGRSNGRGGMEGS